MSFPVVKVFPVLAVGQFSFDQSGSNFIMALLHHTELIVAQTYNTRNINCIFSGLLESLARPQKYTGKIKVVPFHIEKKNYL